MTKTEREKRQKRHEREEVVSRLKLVLIVVCVIMIFVTFWVNHHEVGTVEKRITTIESPCKRYGPQSKVCQRAFETAVRSITHRIACFIDRKAGRPFKESCRGVRLRIEVPSLLPSPGSKGGGALQQPSSTAHQQPSPQHGGSPGGGAGNPGSHAAPVAPNPGSGSAPAPQAPERTAPTASSQPAPAPASEPEPSAPPIPLPAPVNEVMAPAVEGVHQITCQVLVGC